MPRSNLIPALALVALAVNACSDSTSPRPTAPPADLATVKTHTHPQGYPPDGWVFHPKQLAAAFTKFECTFAFPDGVDPRGGPHSACQEKQWGQSGIYREQVRDMLVPDVPSDVCAERVAHFDEIRICNRAWIDQPVTTPWGDTGPKGCVAAIPLNLVCGA
jgi:hypothetical protein